MWGRSVRSMAHTESPVRVLESWEVLDLAAEWVCTQLDPERTVRLRYEDFVADSKGALERIGSLIELDLKEIADAASSGKPMQAGHNVGGNRARSRRFYATIGVRRGMGDGAVCNSTATFRAVNGMAYAPIWIR
jgi:hypothetical protein